MDEEALMRELGAPEAVEEELEFVEDEPIEEVAPLAEIVEDVEEPVEEALDESAPEAEAEPAEEEALPEKTEVKAEAKPDAESEVAKGGHPLQKVKSAEHSCIMIKGKLEPVAGKRYKFVFGQKATVAVKGYPVHIYAYAGLTEKSGVEVLPLFLHVGEGDAPWPYIIKELAKFGTFEGFIIADYCDDIRKALGSVSASTKHFSSITTPAATMPVLSRAHYDFTTHFKRVWQNTGGRVEDYEKLELLSGMCVDTLAEFFKTKTYP